MLDKFEIYVSNAMNSNLFFQTLLKVFSLYFKFISFQNTLVRSIRTLDIKREGHNTFFTELNCLPFDVNTMKR